MMRVESNQSTSLVKGLIKKIQYVVSKKFKLPLMRKICFIFGVTIFLKLTKYSYLHNHSINIYTIYICLNIFPDPRNNDLNVKH